MGMSSAQALSTSERDISDADLLRGIESIAAYIGESKRATYHLAETGAIPAFKLGAYGRGGSVWRMRKSTYLRHVAEMEARAEARALERRAGKRTASGDAA